MKALRINLALTPVERGLLFKAKKASLPNSFEWSTWVRETTGNTLDYAEELISIAEQFSEDEQLRDSRISVFRDIRKYKYKDSEKIARKMVDKGVEHVTVTKIDSIHSKRKTVKDFI